MENIDVSCVVVTFNRLEKLKKALDSIENQTYKNTEVIVIDNCSTDGTKEYLENEELEKNIKIIRMTRKENGNVCRNVAVRESRGEYIAFLDDDDFWEKTKLEKQAAKVASRSNVGLVYCGSYVTNNDRIVASRLPKKEYKGNVSEIIFCEIFATTSCLLIKKKLIEKVGYFDEKLTHWQEYDLMIRLAQITNFEYVDESLVYIDNTPKGRLSNTNIDLWFSSVERIIKKYSEIINGLSIETNKKRVCFFYLDAANRYYTAKNIVPSWKYLYKAWYVSRSIKDFIRLIFFLPYNRMLLIKKIINW